MKLSADLHPLWECWEDPGGHDGPRLPPGPPVCVGVEGAILVTELPPRPEWGDVYDALSDAMWPMRVHTWSVTYDARQGTAVCVPEHVSETRWLDWEPEEPDWDSQPGGWDDY